MTTDTAECQQNDTERHEGSEVPEDLPAPVEWRFDEPQPDWGPVVPPAPDAQPVQTGRTEDALRLTLTEANGFVNLHGRRGLRGAMYVNLPDWKREDWAHVLVRARTPEKVGSLGVGFNLRAEPGSTAGIHLECLRRHDEQPPPRSGRLT